MKIRSKEELFNRYVDLQYRLRNLRNKKGKLIIASGNSAAGKTTIMRKLMKNEIISFTTRDPRPGEKDGVDYQYISKDKYFELLNSGGLVEWTEYGGNYYGLTKEEIESKLNKGNAFVIVDCHGMQQLKELYPNSVSIFIYNNKFDSLRQMLHRGDDITNVNKRMSTYDEEIKNRVHYDYVVKNTNGKLNDVMRVIKQIIKLEVNK